jgi:hypothetical protein
MVLVPVALLMLGVVALAGRTGLLMIGVAALIPAFIFLHYILWGRWLMKSIGQQPRDDDE